MSAWSEDTLFGRLPDDTDEVCDEDYCDRAACILVADDNSKWCAIRAAAAVGINA